MHITINMYNNKYVRINMYEISSSLVSDGAITLIDSGKISWTSFRFGDNWWSCMLVRVIGRQTKSRIATLNDFANNPLVLASWVLFSAQHIPYFLTMSSWYMWSVQGQDQECKRRFCHISDMQWIMSWICHAQRISVGKIRIVLIRLGIHGAIDNVRN